MKRFFISASVALVLLNNTNGQVIMPAKYDSSIKVNYVRTWDALAPITSTDTILTRPYKDVRQTTQYLDGLGRPLQTVIKKGSLVTGDTAKDLVSANVYDELGREVYKYLPFVANSTGSNTSMSDGFFKLNPFQQDSAFNKGMFSDETYYYGKTVFETSPLNRAIETYAPGDNWVGTASQSSEVNRHGIKAKYWINTVADSVRVWIVTDVSNSFGTYATGSIYAAGLLVKNVTQDEHNKQVIEFNDKEGKMILRKVQLTADTDTGTGKNLTGWLCTYYVYDKLNKLRAVIQPKGVELLAASSWSMTSTILDELCFRYEYDSRGRMILKKVPGAGTAYMIYDARDRLVMSQDSLQRAAHKWMYALYDAQNRDTTTGLITDNTYYNDAAYHRSQAENSTAYPNPGSYTNEELTKKFYDNYLWRSWEGNPISATRSTSYDTYLLSPSNTTWPYPQDATVQSNQLTGMVTGTKTEIMGSGTYLYTVNFYDDKGRLIQSQSTNQTTGVDINTIQYSWTGQSLLMINKEEKAGTNAQTSIILTKPTYDDLWRVIKTEKKISTTRVSSGSMPGSWETISLKQYDALGQLKSKRLAPVDYDDVGLETENYEYNIRGWLLGMNRDYVKDTTNMVHWFGFDLGYDKTSFTVNGSSQSYSAAQYNGNIGGMMWRSNGDDMLRKYDFTYDPANRFLSADFNQLNSNSFSKAAKIDFSVFGMSYDANGNILNLNQKGWKLGGSQTIDSLGYGLNTNSNRLNYVTDRANDSTSYLGDFKEYINDTSQDYGYDGNGNVTFDNNKKISSITYNHLNLPDSIRILGKGTIKYTYDASGNKLKKVTVDSTGASVKTTTTLYMMANFINDTLQYIPTEEGRARIKDDSSTMVYDCMIKDHLGNVRMVLTEDTRTDSYPLADMEVADSTTEQTYYSNLSETRWPTPYSIGYPTYPWLPLGGTNDYVAKTNGSGHKIGPAIILKVMAGDTFNLGVLSWWNDHHTPSSSPVDPLSDLLTAIGSSVGTVNGGHPSVGDIQSSSELSNSTTNFLNSQTYNTNHPKAYINWVLFDERFNYVSASSGFEQVGGKDTLTQHTRTDLPVTKSGYLYIYVSNADPTISVYFDNLTVTHIRGPLLEESHYYPFGLIMRGISSKALKFGKENKTKFNGYEENKDLDINMYESLYRTNDPQIGRFWQIDPKPSESFSLYCFAKNNPIFLSDPLGDTTIHGKKYEPNSPEYATTLSNVTVTAKYYNNPYLGLIKSSPDIYAKIVKDVPWERLTKWGGDKIEKWFTNYLNKNAGAYRKLSSKYFSYRLAKYGHTLSGAGELYGALLSFSDYAVAAADNNVGTLPDPSGISNAIIGDLSSDIDEDLINNGINLARKGIYSIAQLGRGLQSASGRGHSVSVTGTYVSSGELVSIYLNGGNVDASKLQYPNYGFTDNYPTNGDVKYNHFILYSDKVFLPIIEK